MRLADVPDQVERTHGYPISHDTLRREFGDLILEVPDGPNQSLGTLLDTCRECGFEDTYVMSDRLRSTLLCCAGADYVGRVGYDDRSGNPTRGDREQVSF
jgi:hypothetical protein